MIVVDASVAIKWFIPGPHSGQASDLLRMGKKLIAPEIIRIEVAVALTGLVHAKVLDESATQTLLKAWHNHLAMQAVSLEPTTADFKAATEISIRIKYPLQGCLYVAVAERLKTPLITVDQELLKKAEAIQCELESL